LHDSKIRNFPDQVGEMALRKSSQLRKLTTAVEDIPTVRVRKYNKALSVFKVVVLAFLPYVEILLLFISHQKVSF
jgi:hypothetical protein